MAASKTAQPQDTVDVLVPSAANREVSFGAGDLQMTYIQKPLSFFQKLEVFSVLGSALDKAMSGPDGLTLSDLFDGPAGVGDKLNERNFRDADTFIKAIAKLVQYTPDLLSDLYVIILGVPKGSRLFVKEVMELPEDEGGLSDDQGFGILDTFVDQNWEVMSDFFSKRIMPLANKMSSKLQESQPSKR